MLITLVLVFILFTFCLFSILIFFFFRVFLDFFRFFILFLFLFLDLDKIFLAFMLYISFSVVYCFNENMLTLHLLNADLLLRLYLLGFLFILTFRMRDHGTWQEWRVHSISIEELWVDLRRFSKLHKVLVVLLMFLRRNSHHLR
jgi:hypothetical protein